MFFSLEIKYVMLKLMNSAVRNCNIIDMVIEVVLYYLFLFFIKKALLVKLPYCKSTCGFIRLLEYVVPEMISKIAFLVILTLLHDIGL